uniref:Uncharacterized protein n=1 Tax=uncultured marine bacterium EB80_02D08 TaxID=415441 RepID=A4GJX2_9BACT|nr:hypothetical protein MBMO_EB80-02D08.0049 [uncultured marine bacterium EB80_02D08]
MDETPPAELVDCKTGLYYWLVLKLSPRGFGVGRLPVVASKALLSCKEQLLCELYRPFLQIDKP